MNDIERLAAVIRSRRAQTVSEQPEDNLLLHNIELPAADITAQSASQETYAASAADSSNTIPVRRKEVASEAEQQSIEVVDSTTQATPQSQPLSDVSSELHNNVEQPSIDIPVDELAAKGFLVPTAGRGLMTEQYRRIKRPLLKNIEGPSRTGANNNVIMVTSSVSGEGKTFTAINLAMSLALERERTVLLVDADVLKNSASGVLQVDKDRPGLTDLLSEEVQNPADVILRTNISNFTYLPSGTSQQNANELLSSARMKFLFGELSSRYQDRIIVLDCPPILQTNEANVITDYAGQIVFVVAEEDTSQAFVVEALKQIPEENYVGIILNKSRKRILGNDYGYTYNYA